MSAQSNWISGHETTVLKRTELMNYEKWWLAENLKKINEQQIYIMFTAIVTL